MWYEIIPPCAIIVVAMTIPGYALHYSHKFFLGNAYRRQLYEHWDWHNFMRDTTLTGDPYKVKTLDDLPDEPPK